VVIFTGLKPPKGPSSAAELATPLSGSETARRMTTRRRRSVIQNKPIIVKFGGSSLARSRLITLAADAVSHEYAKGARIVVIVSAVGRTTDSLLDLTNGGSGMVETDRDDILAMGERTSARIFAASLKSRGIQARYFDPSDRDWPIITDEEFSNANPLKEQCLTRIRRYVSPLLTEGVVPVIGGFIGRTRDGRISTLGRGGSDTTALLFAKALDAEEVVLVTRSQGIMSGDPKIVKDAKVLRKIDMKSLVGIADSGTKFIHRKALRYKDPNINIRVVSNTSRNLRTSGTIITGDPLPTLDVKIHNPDPVASLTLVGKGLPRNASMTREALRIFQDSLLAVSEDSDSMILYVSDDSSTERRIARLHTAVVENLAGVALAVRRGLCLITVRGVGLEETPGVVARISDALRAASINIFGILTITSSVVVVLHWKARKKAANLIRKSLESN
jgi:aspartate kinase